VITPDTSFKSLGILSIIIVWGGLLFLLSKWRGDKSMSFSLHAAQTKSSKIYYFSLFLITIPLFYLFIIKWYVPSFDLPNIFTYFVTAGVLGQLIAVIVPAIKGRKEQIHNFGAYSMAFSMVPISVFIAFADIPPPVRILTIVGIIYMIGAILLFFYVKRTHSSYLYFQAAYIALFHAIIISSTYIR